MNTEMAIVSKHNTNSQHQLSFATKASNLLSTINIYYSSEAELRK